MFKRGEHSRKRAKSQRRVIAEALEERALLSTTSTLVYPGADGRLVYAPDANGDVIPDFSQVGYETGNVALPTAASLASLPTVTLNPGTGDQTTNIQNAINTVSAMTPNASGFRGVVLLNAGN